MKLLIVTFLFACLPPCDLSANWPSWRGPDNSGSTTQGTYPADLSDKSKLKWKIPLPAKGCSTPIIWNDTIILTSPIDGRDAVMAFDWQGKELWRTEIGAERAGRHRNGSGSNPSAIADKTGIYVYFKSGTLAALDHSGKLRWNTNLQKRWGKDTLYWDLGTSPVTTEKNVIAAVMHKGESFVAAFSKESGDLNWKVARNYKTPVEADHSYATPIVIQHRGKTAILVWGAEHLTAHADTDGKLLWSCGDFNPTAKRNWVAVSSPVIIGNQVVVPYGRGSRLHGVKLGGSGDVTATHRTWLREDTGTFVPSPAAYQGKAYLVRDKGEVECVDPTNGKTVWEGRFPKHRAKYYASPTIANGRLYANREDGVVFVAQIDKGFKLLSENNLGERIIASPVPVDGRLLIRGEKHLFCFQN
jgi:outer membrane protein assembly factor BamB